METLEIAGMFTHFAKADEPDGAAAKVQLDKYLNMIDKLEKAGIPGYVLPRKEFALLELLAGRPGELITREEIYEKIWGQEVIVGDRTIDVHIRKLRQKIGEEHIRTIKGVGYLFEN